MRASRRKQDAEAALAEHRAASEPERFAVPLLSAIVKPASQVWGHPDSPAGRPQNDCFK